MAQTSLYKSSPATVRQRVMTTETIFSKGMRYTNQPMVEGYIKSLINFDIKDDGESIKPRGGLQPYTDVIASIPDSYGINTIHNSGTIYVLTEDESDAVLCDYALFGQVTKDKMFRMNHSRLIVNYKDKYLTAEYDGSLSGAVTNEYFLTMTPVIESMCGMTINKPESTSKGVFASIDANTYVLVKDPHNTSGEYHFLGRLYVWFTDDTFTGIKWCIKKVSPQEVPATQVVNYGYNMLKVDPYHFENVQTSTGALVLQGILPYDFNDKLLLSARPGSDIMFRLIYQYPASADRYLVQWEMQNLDADTEPIILRHVGASKEYAAGEDITITCKPTYKHFSITAKVYIAGTYKENSAPDQVLTLSSYYLTADSQSTSKFTEPKTYDLGTAAGMCAWQQRLVVWGVKGASNSIFVSDVNSPDYFPYPNGVELFTSNVIGCVPYLSDLLVFTTDALYRCTLSEDGLSYTVKCIQERLNMIESDINTILTVQNMVYFKSNNYFYMIVPKVQSLTGELQIAPVSRPIEYLIDHFEESIRDILNDIYNIDYMAYNKYVNMSLVDFYVYLDGNQIRNSFKLKFEFYTKNNVLRDTRYLDVQLSYDTVLRAWTIYVNESSKCRDAIFKASATGRAIFYRIYNVDKTSNIILTKFNDDDHADTVPLDDSKEYLFRNYQYIDTGYRKHNEELKKRYREVDFCINCLGKKKLKFYTGFVLDDDVRRSYYKHKTVHCTDKDDPSYGMLFVERVLDDSVDGKSLTLLDTEWVLDTSQFPDLTITKIRYKISGKGYNGAVKILSTNETDFEILDVSWVYRVMFAR